MDKFIRRGSFSVFSVNLDSSGDSSNFSSRSPQSTHKQPLHTSEDDLCFSDIDSISVTTDASRESSRFRQKAWVREAYEEPGITISKRINPSGIERLCDFLQLLAPFKYRLNAILRKRRLRFAFGSWLIFYYLLVRSLFPFRSLP